MRALVTGASGCLGRALIDVLRDDDDWQLRTTARAPVNLPGFVAADLVTDDLDAILDNVDVVFHCAALSSAWGTEDEFQAANVTATRRLLDAAQRAGVGSFVFASTPSLYADGTDRLDVTEDATLPERCATRYAQSKREAERLVLAQDGVMKCNAIRPRAIYGAHDRALLPRLITAMRRGTVPMIDGGRALIDVTHRHDAARAMILAAGGPGGRVWNITSGRAFSFRELVEIVAQQAGLRFRRLPIPYSVAMSLAGGAEKMAEALGLGEPRLTRQAVSSLGRSLTLDISAARRDLGYQPKVSFEEGVTECFG